MGTAKAKLDSLPVSQNTGRSSHASTPKCGWRISPPRDVPCAVSPEQRNGAGECVHRRISLTRSYQRALSIAAEFAGSRRYGWRLEVAHILGQPNFRLIFAGG